MNVCFNKHARAQVNAPSLRCLSVNTLGNITLNWVIPPDPLGLFTRYEIYTAPISSGPFTLVTSINTYTQNTYLHVTGAGNVQSQYYYIKTIYSGVSSSLPSDTLRSIFVNLVNPGGQAILNWNATRTPLLATASNSYIVERQDPSLAWTTLYNGTSQIYKDDSISICDIFYNYKVTTSDAMGCTSQSNIDGDLFHDLTPPEIPILDSVSVNALGLATLGWEPSKAADCIGYHVFKFTGVWSFVADVVGRFNTSYTNPTSTASTGSEKYCILAYDSCNNLGLQSIVNTTEQNTLFLTAKYDLCSRSALLTWNTYDHMLNGFLEYDIYCSINGGVASVINTLTSTNYTHSSLNPSDNYCYFIRVRNSDKSISAISNQACVFAKAPSGPSYVYLKSVNVNLNKQIEVSYTIDNTKVYKGATIFKSVDGITFNQIGYQAYSTSTLQVFIDTDVNTSEKPYYYKIQISDSCGNPSLISNTSKSILLHVSNDNSNIFYNTLTWDDYSTWLGSVNSYNIYRAINGTFEPTPIANVSSGTKTYTDDVQDFSSDQGKFSYYVEAVEGAGNIYGFIDKANSNVADAYVEAEIFVPNAFAPKGINKIWLPIAQYVEKTDYRVTVFDRWGTRVFETNSDTQGWDGKNATDDVFIYLIEYKNARGEYIQIKGHLNLVR